MKARELAAQLRVLKQFDVARYSVTAAGDVTVVFRDAPPPEPEALQGAAEELPDGVLPDIRGKLADINRRAAERS